MPDIHIAEAQKCDSHDIFTWRNDLTTRKMFFNQELVSWDDHVEWFEKSLNNNSRKMLIGMLDSHKIGIVRFDIVNNNATISINLNPEFRGKNLASQLLILAEKHIPNIVIELSAEIKKNNEASVKTFKKSGYIFHSCDNETVVYKKRIKN